MVVYSINDIERLTGVKAHTLRMWERRFNIIPSRRTETNIRYFLDEDLQLILNIAILNKNGYKISKIAGLHADEVKSIVANLYDVEQIFEDQVDGLMLAMFELNEFNFNKILDHEIENHGFEHTMNQVIYPMLDKINMMWMSGSVKAVHESFVTNFLKRKLIVEIDRIHFKTINQTQRCLVFLPEGESHELSLLFLHYILKSHGIHVLNLGGNVSVPEVYDACTIFKPSHVVTVFNDSFSEAPIQPYIDQLVRVTEGTTLVLSGYQTIKQKINLSKDVVIQSSLDELKAFLIKDLQEAKRLSHS